MKIKNRKSYDEIDGTELATLILYKRRSEMVFFNLMEEFVSALGKGKGMSIKTIKKMKCFKKMTQMELHINEVLEEITEHSDDNIVIGLHLLLEEMTGAKISLDINADTVFQYGATHNLYYVAWKKKLTDLNRV